MPPSLTLVASLNVLITAPLSIGQNERGLQEVIPIAGGSVNGPLLHGKVLAGGADWCLTRPDGISEVSARYTLQLDDGQLITVQNSGLAHPLSDGSYGGRTIPQFEVAEGPLSWLRRSIFIGTLLAHASGAQVDIAFFRVD